jgi:hypothetical protein
MAVLGRLIGLAKSPQGRRLVMQAAKAARDPRNRERLQDVRSRVRSRTAEPPSQRVTKTTDDPAHRS